MKVFSVIFKENGKSYYFNGEDNYKINDKVIVETERGLQFGRINNILEDFSDMENNKQIIRLVSAEDEKKYYKLLKENKIALEKCREFVEELNLNMNVLSAEFTFEKEQLLFNFVSEERVDFRELAKKLASIYHTRIELRQIGARDKAKEVGGCGICGEKLCCTRFLSHIDAISMNMAKNQNLALNPSKINGVCGRLLCCLQYEDENYVESAKELPSVGEVVKTNNGEGKVVSVDILNRKCKVLIDGNKEEIEYK